MKEIKLNKSGKVTFVDDEDFYWLDQWNWYLQDVNPNFYAYRCGKKSRLRNGNRFENSMHRVVMRLSNPQLLVDHIDGNGLNNQKSNLRVCTKTENSWNKKRKRAGTTSRYLGVTFSRERGLWTAQLKSGGIQYLSARFTTEEDAARAYDLAAIQQYGKFAGLNFEDSIEYEESLKEIVERNRIPSSEARKIACRLNQKKSDRRKKVINIHTGEIFESAASILTTLNIPASSFYQKLQGITTNNTEYKYL